MQVHNFCTAGGKDLIETYIDGLPIEEQGKAYDIIDMLESDGLKALEFLDTRQLSKKLWEIKFYRHNRFMYIVADKDNIYILHACKKQKGKAEKFELEKAIERAKELDFI